LAFQLEKKRALAAIEAVDLQQWRVADQLQSVAEWTQNGLLTRLRRRSILEPAARLKLWAWARNRRYCAGMRFADMQGQRTIKDEG
jgi:hypothetical protein